MGWPEARWHDPPRAYAPSAPLVYTEVQMAAVKSELAAAEKQLAVANGRIAAAKTALGG